MGSVAFIEERQKCNMSLGIPARESVVWLQRCRFTRHGDSSTVTGEAGAGAGAATVFYAAAACLLLILGVQYCRTMQNLPAYNQSYGLKEDNSTPSRDLVVIASVQIALATATLLSVNMRLDRQRQMTRAATGTHPLPYQRGTRYRHRARFRFHRSQRVLSQ